MPLATLRKLIDPGPAGQTDRASVAIDGITVPVLFRRNAKARRIILRMNAKEEGLTLTVPPGTSHQEALNFAVSQSAWIAARLKRQPQIIPFEHGVEIPVRGIPHLIRHLPNARGTARSEASHLPGEPPSLIVAGREEHLNRRLRDWLKAEARRDLVAASSKYARSMGLRYSRINMRDQSSRWGSCSSTGALSYSWRLIMAPSDVLDYVAAHEVAHLKEMNHSPRFWKLVETHCEHSKPSRHWLKTHGMALHQYGR